MKCYLSNSMRKIEEKAAAPCFTRFHRYPAGEETLYANAIFIKSIGVNIASYGRAVAAGSYPEEFYINSTQISGGPIAKNERHAVGRAIRRDAPVVRAGETNKARVNCIVRRVFKKKAKRRKKR